MGDTRTTISALTSIRFFAAMSVVSFHAGSAWAATQHILPKFAVNLLINGYVGVIVFFVLSGFILQIVYQGRFENRSDVVRYGVARLARVYPVYLLSTVIFAPAIAAFTWGSVPQFFMLQSWTTMPGVETWNFPAWTLSVELFFYIWFPLISKISRRLSLPSLVAIMVALCGIVLEFHTSSLPQTAGLDWKNSVPSTVLRLPEFLMGVVAGELFLRGRSVALGMPPIYFVLAMIAAMFFTVGDATSVSTALLAPFLCSALAADTNTRLVGFLGNRWLVLLGGASYSLYLIHQPLRYYLGLVVNENKLLLLLQYPLVIILSVIVFLYFEEPLRERIRHWAGMGKSANAAIADVVEGSLKEGVDVRAPSKV